VTEAVETPTKDVIDPKDKIPGLEITWGDAETLEWNQNFIKVLQDSKKAFTNVHTIPVADKWYVIRSLNRREYRTLVQEQATILSKEMEVAQEGGNVDAARATISMIAEEGVAVRGTIWPELDKDTIRNLPSGVATTIHDTILQISGYQNQPTPIKV